MRDAWEPNDMVFELFYTRFTGNRSISLVVRSQSGDNILLTTLTPYCSPNCARTSQKILDNRRMLSAKRFEFSPVGATEKSKAPSQKP